VLFNEVTKSYDAIRMTLRAVHHIKLAVKAYRKEGAEDPKERLI
jgi:hypothetical protein